MREMIDKYKLKSIFSPAVTGKTEYSTTEILFAIENQPTVEAILIQWIKEYAQKKSANDGMDCYWTFWEEDVLRMIEEWEKDNGDDF